MESARRETLTTNAVTLPDSGAKLFLEGGLPMRTGVMSTALRCIGVYAGCVVGLAATLTAQGYKLKWVCDPKEQRLYRRDLGVVCWDGKTYRKTDPGGIPQYMIDYFDQMRQNIRRAVGDTRQTKTTPQTARPPGTDTPHSRSTGSSVLPVRQAPPSLPSKPLDPALLASVEPGMTRSKLREKLGQPGSALTITSSHEVLETWTYALTDGRTANFRIKDGVLASYQIEGQKPTQ